MAEKSFNQSFEGYWREPNKGSLPQKSGVYCVYECTFNQAKKNVSIHELIYIGESEDVNKRVSNHEKLKDWEKHVRKGNQLCYCFTEVDDDDRDRVEAALINKHKPPENTEYKNDFPFDTTSLDISGDAALLEKSFVVKRK
jgi:excinuclease UvrABC nuclease subunit